VGLKGFIKGGFKFGRQKPGARADGPIAGYLAAMAGRDAQGQPLSSAGSELAAVVHRRNILVLFVPTGGAGAAPWNGLIVLDRSYAGAGQPAPSSHIGLVAHELTHVLQRALRDRRYWPSGFLRPDRHTRWFGDSTNYMEVLAYIIGSVVEHDLETSRLSSAQLTDNQKKRIQDRLGRLEALLATYADEDARNAARHVVQRYPGNRYYKQNHYKEAHSKDGRIPPGGWVLWLKRFGFSQDTVDHIRAIAGKSVKARVKAEEIDKLAGVEKTAIERGAPAAGPLSITTLLYLAGRYLLTAVSGLEDASNLALPTLDWVAGYLLGAFSRLFGGRAEPRPEGAGSGAKSTQSPAAFWLIGLGSTLAVVIGILWGIRIGVDLGVVTGNLDFTATPGLAFSLLAFAVGAGHQVIARISSTSYGRLGQAVRQAGAEWAQAWRDFWQGLRAIVRSILKR
jgi:hypothetical protein